VDDALGRLADLGKGAGAAQALLQGLLDRLADEECLGLLATAAAAGERREAEVYQRVLSRLPASVLRKCALRLRHLPPGSVKEAWQKVLASRGHEDPSALIAWIEDEGGEAAVEALKSALSGGKVPGAGAFLHHLIGHADERVRAEALKVSASLGHSARRALIETGLADKVLRVRLAALRAAEGIHDAGLIPMLRKRLEEHRDEDDESIRTLHAIASLGGAPAAGCLREALSPGRRWRFFRPKGHRSVKWRRAAVLALQDVTDQAVMDLLQEGTTWGEKPLADACRTALTLIESRRRSGK
jgi:hypothetical protein